MMFTCDVCGRKVEKKEIFFNKSFVKKAREYYGNDEIRKIGLYCLRKLNL